MSASGKWYRYWWVPWFGCKWRYTPKSQVKWSWTPHHNHPLHSQTLGHKAGNVDKRNPEPYQKLFESYTPSPLLTHSFMFFLERKVSRGPHCFFRPTWPTLTWGSISAMSQLTDWTSNLVPTWASAVREASPWHGPPPIGSVCHQPDQSHSAPRA